MESTAKNGAIYEFDGFRLVTAEELLLRNGAQIPLNIKSFGVLKMLVERHGHLVTKSEIIDTVWEDAFVDEGSLAKAIWTIRQALGDTSKEKFIQTVPRRGYRFVFPVSVRTDSPGAFPPSNLTGFVEADKLSAAEPTQQSTNGGSGDAAARVGVSSARERSAKSFPRWGAAVGIVLLLLTGVAVYLTLSWQNTLDKGETSRLIVMPLKPLDPQARDEIYDRGIAEALISKLSADKKLRVRRLDAVRLSSDGNDDPIKVGTEQKVDYVLSSHYQLANGKIKVTARLFDVASGDIVGDFPATTESAEPFAAHEAIANDIGNRLLARFGSGASEYRPKLGTSNEDAYRYCLMAQNFIEQRGFANGREALEQIERAVELDPNFARGWATKAYIHRYIDYGADAHERYRKSMEAVEKALAIDPNLSEAHSVGCFNKFRYEYDFAGAESACKRALELDPNSPLAHKLYANFLYTRGRFDESIAEIEKTMDLQPISYDNQQTYGLALYFARKYDEAEAQWKRLIPLNPDHSAFIYQQLVRSLERQEKESEAFQYLIEWLATEKQSDETIKRFRTAYKTSGWRGVTLERIRITESRGSSGAFELARLYATINDKDNAFKYLERSYQGRSHQIAVLRVDPELDSLREDPRYVELLTRVEAPK